MDDNIDNDISNVLRWGSSTKSLSALGNGTTSTATTATCGVATSAMSTSPFPRRRHSTVAAAGGGHRHLEGVGGSYDDEESTTAPRLSPDGNNNSNSSSSSYRKSAGRLSSYLTSRFRYAGKSVSSSGASAPPSPLPTSTTATSVLFNLRAYLLLLGVLTTMWPVAVLLSYQDVDQQWRLMSTSLPGGGDGDGTGGGRRSRSSRSRIRYNHNHRNNRNAVPVSFRTSASATAASSSASHKVQVAAPTRDLRDSKRAKNPNFGSIDYYSIAEETVFARLIPEEDAEIYDKERRIYYRDMSKQIGNADVKAKEPGRFEHYDELDYPHVENGGCYRLKWSYAHHPTCNFFHEVTLDRTARKTEIRGGDRETSAATTAGSLQGLDIEYLGHGTFRDSWSLRNNHNYNTTVEHDYVLKVSRINAPRNFDSYVMSQIQVEALFMEETTASDRVMVRYLFVTCLFGLSCLSTFRLNAFTFPHTICPSHKRSSPSRHRQRWSILFL